MLLEADKRPRGRPRKDPSSQDLHVRCDRELIKDIQERGIPVQFIFDLGISFLYPDELEKNLSRVEQDHKLLNLVKNKERTLRKPDEVMMTKNNADKPVVRVRDHNEDINVPFKIQDPEMFCEMERLGFNAEMFFAMGMNMYVDDCLRRGNTINLGIVRRYKESQWARSQYPELLMAVDNPVLNDAERRRDRSKGVA